MRNVAWFVGIVVVVGGLLRVFAFDLWVVPDEPVLAASLAPTLATGDLVVVMHAGTPEVGDLVICEHPKEEGEVVGRIAAEGGDRLSIVNTTVTVNRQRFGDAGRECVEPSVVIAHPSSGGDVEIRCGSEEIGSTWHFVGRGMAPWPVDVEVSPDTWFLLSDNRGYPYDSRTYGPVRVGSCRAVPVFRIWSAEGWGDVDSRMTFLH